MSEVEDLSSLVYLSLDLVLGNLTELESESHIVENCHVRIKSVVLENHRNISVLGRDIVYKAVADVKLTL